MNSIKANKCGSLYRNLINGTNAFLKTLFKASVEISKRIDNFILVVKAMFI